LLLIAVIRRFCDAFVSVRIPDASWAMMPSAGMISQPNTFAIEVVMDLNHIQNDVGPTTG